MSDKPEGPGGFDKKKIRQVNAENRKKKRSNEMQELDTKKRGFVNALYSHLKG